jgi:hypothetical protein
VRKTIPALCLLLGLFVGLTAARASAQKVTYVGLASPAGYAEVGPGSADTSSPFVPEDAANSGRGMGPSSPGGLPGLAAVDKSGSPPGGCGAGCQCCGCGCGDCDVCRADCDACPGIGTMFFAGMESFRGISDGDFQNNNGMVVGGNVGMPIPLLRNYGFGVQLGGSLGAYDFDGRTSNSVGTDAGGSDVQQQVFVTLGIFRRATEKLPFNMAFAYDWMINDAYGVYATSPRLGQFRSQFGWAFNASNEIGVWSAINDRGDSKNVADPAAGSITVSYRPLSQANVFWHHNFDSGADSWLWAGAPEAEKLGDGGRPGEYTVGLTMQVPLTNRVALYGSGQYMRPTATAGPIASIKDAYSVGFGLEFFPRGSSRNRTVAGNCWMPVLPVANNGSFLVDTTGIPP